MKVSPLMGIMERVTHERSRSNPPRQRRRRSGSVVTEEPRRLGGKGAVLLSFRGPHADTQDALTGQVRPGRDAADGVGGVAAQTVVQQLPISDPEAQQDPVDLLLGGGLRGGEETGS